MEYEIFANGIDLEGLEFCYNFSCSTVSYTKWAFRLYSYMGPFGVHWLEVGTY